MFLRDGLHSVLQDAVNAVLHGNFRVARLNMDIAGAPLKRGEDDSFHQANYRTRRAVSCQAIAGDCLLGFLFLFGRLEGKRFRGLFQNALGLFRALQYVGDLPRRRNANQQLLAEQQGQLIAALNQSRIRSGNRQYVVVRFERHEVVAEHQVGGNRANQLRVNALLA